MSDPIDIVERLRKALPALKGWGLDRVEPGEDIGTAEIGGSHEDGDFAALATVDTGLYYQDDHAMPLAEAIAAAVTAAPVLLAEIDRLRAALAQPAAPGWRPIETAPMDGRKIIVWYLNRNTKARTVMARWLTDEQASETDADGVGLEGGWFECIDNLDDYTEVAIHEGDPTHWMPLPAAPQAPQPGELGA